MSISWAAGSAPQKYYIKGEFAGLDGDYININNCQVLDWPTPGNVALVNLQKYDVVFGSDSTSATQRVMFNRMYSYDACAIAMADGYVEYTGSNDGLNSIFGRNCLAWNQGDSNYKTTSPGALQGYASSASSGAYPQDGPCLPVICSRPSKIYQN